MYLRELSFPFTFWVSRMTYGCSNRKFWSPILYFKFLQSKLVRKAPTLSYMPRSMVPIWWSSIIKCFSTVLFWSSRFWLPCLLLVILYLSSLSKRLPSWSNRATAGILTSCAMSTFISLSWECFLSASLWMSFTNSLNRWRIKCRTQSVAIYSLGSDIR